MKSLAERFFAKVKVDPGGCWQWTGARISNGYGNLRRNSRCTALAHRISYEMHVGEIPDGMVVDHTCHNRACVNPEHLQVVTSKQNCENLRGARRDNHSSGIRGVTWHALTRKWEVQVGHRGRNIHCGLFKTLDEAEAAAIAKRNELFTNNLLDRRTP